MTPQQIYVIISLFTMLVVLIVFLIFRKEISSFLFPHKWAKIMMLESDNNVYQWLQPKNKDLRFTFNDGFYNMFESRILNNEKNSIFTSIYRDNRLPCFIYVEGNENPIDLRKIEATGNPQLNRQIQDIDISKLFVYNKFDLFEILQRYWWVIVAVLVIAFALRYFGAGGA